MKCPTRRHRFTATPVSAGRVIRPYEIDERYVGVLQHLEPYHHFKYATIPWLHYLCRPDIEYSVFRKYLGYLREEPNRYVACPEQQLASPNVPYKTLVYQIAERGLTLLRDRGFASDTSTSQTAGGKKSKRSRGFAGHRAHSYYHEIIVDLGYYAPLRHLVRTDASLRLVEFAQLRTHVNVPLATRTALDPLLVHLKDASMRFDGTPHVIVRTREDGSRRAVGIPGIQVDRGTETFDLVERHLRHALEYVEERLHERLWAFDNCLIPFLFTKVARQARAMAYLTELRAQCPFILFKTVPDIGLLPHFPNPRHYDPAYRYGDDEWRPPPSIHLFTTPWQRAGCTEFCLNTFKESSSS